MVLPTLYENSLLKWAFVIIATIHKLPAFKLIQMSFYSERADFSQKKTNLKYQEPPGFIIHHRPTCNFVPSELFC